jgi:hypothetical protein
MHGTSLRLGVSSCSSVYVRVKVLGEVLSVPSLADDDVVDCSLTEERPDAVETREGISQKGKVG